MKTTKDTRNDDRKEHDTIRERKSLQRAIALGAAITLWIV